MIAATMEANLCKRDGDEDDSDGGGGLSLPLPKDIILEVLLTLPAKDLSRCRCVCRSWRALISDPSFVAVQRSRATGPFMVAMFGSAPEHELRLLDMKSGNVLRVFDIRGRKASLAPRTRLDLIFVDRAELGGMIIDPAASGRHFTVVGTTDAPPLPWWTESPLATTSMSDYSFGRAAASGDYKVLHLVTSWRERFGRSRLCEVATITSNGGVEPTWRRRPWGPFFDATFSCDDKAAVNGVLYFMPDQAYAAHERTRIAAFDLESEEWNPQTIKCPRFERMGVVLSHTALTEIKGTLCMVQNINLTVSGRHCVNIWLLTDPNKSVWVKECTIQMLAGRFLLCTTPLDVSGDDGTILLLVNVSRNVMSYFRYVLQFYNSSTKDFTDFVEIGGTTRVHWYSGILRWVPPILTNTC